MGPPDSRVPWDSDALARALHGEEVFSTVEVDGEPIRILSKPAPRGGPVVGVIQAPYPLRDVYRSAAVVNQALLLLLPIALLNAGFAGSLLTRTALRPVRQISEAARSIEARDLSLRLPASGHDEFSELSNTFNGMLERLETTFAEQSHLVERLRQMVHQQRRFVADASHELKTPLTAIRANTSLCLSGHPSAEELRQSMEDIDQVSNSMVELVGDLLLLSRSDAGQLGRNAAELRVCDVAEKAVANVKMAQPECAPITIKIADESLHLYGNEGEIVRLLTNLVGNAARYTPLEGRIQVVAADQEGWLRVRISDTGGGIPAEHLAHLGERFYRVDSSRARPEGGTGLGISICKGIVEAHQGTMEIQSIVGVGTQVTLLMPMSAAGPPAPQTPASTSTRPEAQWPLV